MERFFEVVDDRKVSSEAKTLDKCKPEDMVDILLSRLKENPLDDNKKSLLIVEFEDLRLFFQKHPQQVELFRNDLLEWRKFLKQSKEYMNEFFNKKMAKTQQIIQHIKNKTVNVFVKKDTHPTLHYNRKAQKPKDWDPKSPEPTFYEILFRPGIRSIREYPITEERYGERNVDVDTLHKLTAMLRHEIIYTPLSKVSSKTKEELLKILISVVQITAYDVLLGIVLIDCLAILVRSIPEGEDYRKRTQIVEAMKSITDNITECSRTVWEKNKGTEKQMWENINTIKKRVELRKKPKFDEEILMKSAFLRKERMKNVLKPPESPIIIEPEISNVKQTIASEEEPQDGGSLNVPPNSRAESSRSKIAIHSEGPNQQWSCNTCDEYRQKYGEDFLRAMKEPEKKFKIVDIPEVDDEPETIFKMKHVPKFDYALLRKIHLPTQPDLFDVTDPLKTAVRLVVGPEQREMERPEGISYKAIRNPYVNRKRLFKY